MLLSFPILTDEQKKTLADYNKKVNKKLEEDCRLQGLYPSR